MFPFSLGQSWAIDNVVVPLASGYGLTEEYKYLKSSISQYLTGLCVYFLLREHIHDRAGLPLWAKVAFALKNGSVWFHFVRSPPQYSCMKLHSLCLFLFVVGEELEKLGREAGFTVAKHYELGGGLMGNLVATR